MSGGDGWIDGNYDIRKVISLDTIPVDIETVTSAVGKLGAIRRVVRRFHKDWRNGFLRADWDTLSSSIPNSGVF